MSRMDFIDRVLHARILRRWRLATKAVGRMPHMEMRDLRRRARELRRALTEFSVAADNAARARAKADRTVPQADGADWSWRAPSWARSVTPSGLVSPDSRARFGDDLAIFHDCSAPEFVLRQTLNSSEVDGAPYCLNMDMFHFDGSFLSLVVDLPQDAMHGLTKSHVIRVVVGIEKERAIEVFVRLNVQHGPNTEQIVKELDTSHRDAVIEFDLAYSKLNERRVEKAWVDLIFEGAQMNRVVLRDLAFSRYMRAPL